MRRSMTVRLGAITLLCFLVLGCGGEPGPVTDRDATLRLRMTEYRFEPQNITVQATGRPTRIHVVARNEGKLTHNVVIESIEKGDEQSTDVQSTVFMKSDTAHPGDTVSDDAYLHPGEYRITCSIGNHDNLGMYGKLTVLAPKDS
jgi:plastocyanin